MSGGRSLRRLWRHPYVFTASAILFLCAAATIGPTFATFTADTQNQTSTVANSWIAAPTNLSFVGASGYDGLISWTPGGHGNTGEQVWAKDNGSSTSCSTSGYSQVSGSLGASTGVYTDSHATNALNGHEECYEIVSTLGNWTATSTPQVGQLGLVATSIALGNGGGTLGTVQASDTITITFNQAPTAITTGSRDVCFNAVGTSNLVIIGDTAGTPCNSTGDANDVGTISGFTFAGGGAMGATAAVNCTASTFAISSSTLTITLGTCSGTPTVTGGPGTYTPASTIKSAALTDQASICTSASSPNCRPTTTGGW